MPDQDPAEVFAQLQKVLTDDPPWGVKVTVKDGGAVKWWMTDPTGPAFEAATTAMRDAYGKAPASIGCGGSIGFVGPLADLFGGARRYCSASTTRAAILTPRMRASTRGTGET